jgi:hypothetical protein
MYVGLYHVAVHNTICVLKWTHRDTIQQLELKFWSGCWRQLVAVSGHWHLFWAALGGTWRRWQQVGVTPESVGGNVAAVHSSWRQSYFLQRILISAKGITKERDPCGS